MNRSRRIVLAALPAALGLASGGLPLARAADDAAPSAPCDGETPVPPYAGIGKPPNVRTWKAVPWKAPRCLPWGEERYRLIVALAARFAYRGEAVGLLERFGAISRMTGMRYWSVTDQAWRVLIEDAFAAAGPSVSQRRPDFVAREMQSGVKLYLVERDNRSGTVLYSMQVLEARADRIAITTENVTPVRALGFTLFPPASLRAAHFVQRRDKDAWDFYGLSTSGEKASVLAVVSAASYVNRATALYSHFTAGP